jgi:capsular polysaccharide transport system ATP-binding protein
VIVFHSVTKTVGKAARKHTILNEVNWLIPRRAHYVILGHHGSGKTTLLHVMAGIKPPTLGWVERRGVLSSPVDLMRYARGTIFGRQVVRRLAAVFHVEPSYLEAFIADFVGLKEVMNIPLASLPRQARQLFGFGLYYGLPCDYYLFDAKIPTGKGLVRDRVTEVFLRRRRESGMIFTTSDIRAARQFGGKGAVLHNGQIFLFDFLEDAIAFFGRLPAGAAATHRDEVEEQVEPDEGEDFLI